MPLTVPPVIVRLDLELTPMPPPLSAAKLSEIATSVSVIVPSWSLQMPPPPPSMAVLPVTVDASMKTWLGTPVALSSPALNTPPPLRASLAEITEPLRTRNVPVAAWMPPPSDIVALAVTVTASRISVPPETL